MPQRILVASDIHGHGDALIKLLSEAVYNAETDQLVLLGDYVNNGPDSVGTLRLVQKLVNKGAIALVGNHELRWLERQDSEAQAWHKFLSGLPYIKVLDSYIFVHAGIDVRVPIDKQQCEHVTAHHSVALNQHQIKGKTIIHGHVPNYKLGYSKEKIHIENGMIDIDTGAGHNMYLTLVDLTNACSYSVNVSHKDGTIRKRHLML